MALLVFQTRLCGFYVRRPLLCLPFVRLRGGRLGRDMSALGVLFGVGTALGTHGASEGWVCSPVRQYVGIANITKNDMHAIHAFDTAHHTWTCLRGSIAGYVTVFWGLGLRRPVAARIWTGATAREVPAAGSQGVRYAGWMQQVFWHCCQRRPNACSSI